MPILRGPEEPGIELSEADEGLEGGSVADDIDALVGAIVGGSLGVLQASVDAVTCALAEFSSFATSPALYVAMKSARSPSFQKSTDTKLTGWLKTVSHCCKMGSTKVPVLSSGLPTCWVQCHWTI